MMTLRGEGWNEKFCIFNTKLPFSASLKQHHRNFVEYVIMSGKWNIMKHRDMETHTVNKQQLQ